MKTSYQLSQVISDPRSGEDRMYPFESFLTLTEAKKAAKKEFGNLHWVIEEHKIVAISADLQDTFLKSA